MSRDLISSEVFLLGSEMATFSLYLHTSNSLHVHISSIFHVSKFLLCRTPSYWIKAHRKYLILIKSLLLRALYSEALGVRTST